MKFRFIEIKDIVMPKYKLRFESDLMDIDDLVHSIKLNGLICPLTVTPLKNRWKLVAGQRRLLACKKLGWEKIPCAVLDEKGKVEDLVRSIEGNLQRLNLTPLERAQGFKELTKGKYGLTEGDIGRRTGKSESNISHHLRLFKKLPKEILDYLYKGEITFGHAVALMILENKKDQLAIAKRVVKKDLSIARTSLRVDQARPPDELTVREQKLNVIEKDVEDGVGPDWWKKIDIKQGKEEEEIKIKFSEREGLKDHLLKIADSLNRGRKKRSRSSSPKEKVSRPSS